MLLTGGRCNGSMPFKGDGNRATLCNVIEQPLRFPSDDGGPPTASAAARDLIDGLLVKETQKRIAFTFTRGATVFLKLAVVVGAWRCQWLHADRWCVAIHCCIGSDHTLLQKNKRRNYYFILLYSSICS
jgi:hypothetical protein